MALLSHTENRTILEVVPKQSLQIISVGLSSDLADLDEDNIKNVLKNTYSKQCSIYKTLFKSFNNNTFIFREHYSLEIDENNIPKTIASLEDIKNVTEDNLTHFFKSFEMDKIDIKFIVLYGLSNTTMSLFEETMKENSFENVVSEDGNYKIFLKGHDIFLLSNLKWFNTGSKVMDYVYSFHKEFSQRFNPHLTEHKKQQFEGIDNIIKSILVDADKNLRIHTVTRVDLPLKARTDVIKENLFIPYLFSFPVIFMIFVFSVINSFILGAISSILMMASMGGAIYILKCRGH